MGFRKPIIGSMAAALVVVAFGLVTPAMAQSAPPSQKQLDIAAIKANRKALVGQAMALSDQESQGFWPLYEQYESKMDAL